jgi:hypothetical protein
MEQSFNELRKYAVWGVDGLAGKVVDFFFDDRNWQVRYFVVKTRTWPGGKKVLIVPSVLRFFNTYSHVLSLSLTKRQIIECPSSATDQPVGKQLKAAERHRYGMEMYFAGEMFFYDQKAVLLSVQEPRNKGDAEFDPHLHAAGDVRSFGAKSEDGQCGLIEDLLLDHSWNIESFAVQFGGTASGKKILVRPWAVANINYQESCVSIKLTDEEIKAARATKGHHVFIGQFR